MTTVTVHEAKTHLSRLIADVLDGKDVVIARGKLPVVKIVPLKPLPKQARVPGRLAGQVKDQSKGILDHGFWEPLPPDELARWNGEGD